MGGMPAGGGGASQLTWRRPGVLRRRYVLSAGDASVAELQVTGIVNQHAHYRSESGSYDYTRGAARMRVREAGGTELGEMRLSWPYSKGTLVAAGVTLTWRRLRGFREFAFEDAAGVQPVRFWRENRWSGRGTNVDVHPEWAAWPHVGMLIGLGWYWIVLRDRRSASFWGVSPPR